MENLDLWGRAVQELDAESQNKIRSLRRGPVSLESVLSSAEKKRKECESKQWKFKKRDGTEVELREVFAKVVQRLVKFKAIGDSVATIDSAHLAVPWAAIGLALQVAISDVETYQTVFEGIEILSTLIPRYDLFERLYLQRTFSLQGRLKDVLVKMYATALKYCLKAGAFFSTSTIKRIAKGLLLSYGEFDAWMSEIREQQRIADELARLIDVQASRLSDDKLDLIQTSQVALMEGLRTFHEPIESIKCGLIDLISSWTKHQEQQQESQIFKWLDPLPQLGVHKNRLVPGSGRWIFDQEEYIDWRVSSRSAILWLQGPLATGKSTLISTIIDNLEASHPHAPGGLLAYAFFSRDKANTGWQDPRALVCSLIAQLARSKPLTPLRDEVICAYENMAQRGGDNAVAQGAHLLWNDAAQLLLELTSRETTTLCIDAIDECASDLRDDFIELIDNLLTRVGSGRVKVIISSRPLQDLARRYPDWPSISVDLEHNRADIEGFAQQKAARCVERLQDHPNRAKLEKDVTKHLIDGAQGMFLWIKLRATLLLRQSASPFFEEDLLLQPSTDLLEPLIQLYENIFKLITRLPEASRARKMALTVFRWLLCAQAPVPAEDLARALSVEMQKNTIEPNRSFIKLDVAMILESCQNLVLVDENSSELRFVHTSVREFLERKSELQSETQHAMVADLCLATIQKLATDMSTNSPIAHDRFHYYVVLYWPLHVARAGEKHHTMAINDALNDLCEERPWVQHWIHRIQPALLTIGWNDPHKDKIMQVLSSPATSFFTSCAFGFDKVVHHCIQSSKELVHQVNDMGATGLHLAAEYGHREIAEALYKSGANLDSLNNDGETPLVRAAAAGRENLVLFLLKEGASLETHGRRFGTALHGAALNGHLNVVEMLLNNSSEITACGGQFGTALHDACLRGHVRVVRRLLDAGADINAAGEARNQSLEASETAPSTAENVLLAVQREREEQRKRQLRHLDGELATESQPASEEAVFQLLLDHNVNLNILPKGLGPPLHTAARAGHDAIVDLLLQNRNIYPEIEGGEYGTALQAAAVSGRTSIIQKLLDAKVAINTQAGKYGTALIAACRHANPGVVELLIQSGAAVNIQSGVYGTALHAACRSGNHILVQRLLELGADVNLTGSNYHTALQAATRNGYEHIVELLLRHGADVNVRGGYSGSALQAAAAGGHKKVVKMLYEARAKIGESLQFACFGGHFSIVEFLLEKGCDINHCGSAFGTAFQAALVGHHASLALWLFENKAVVTDAGGKWGTGLGLAALTGEADLVRICLDQGADPWARNKCEYMEDARKLGSKMKIEHYFSYPIVFAAAGGHSEIVTILLHQLRDKNPKSSDVSRDDLSHSLRGALFMALQSKQEKIVGLLLDHVLPLDFNTVESACSNLNSEAVIKLLELEDEDDRASIRGRYKRSLHALSTAVSNQTPELVKMLLPRVVRSQKYVDTDLAGPLRNAVSGESLEILTSLLDCGAISTPESDSFRKAHAAELILTEMTGDEGIVQAHLPSNEDPILGSDDYGQALQSAAGNGAEDKVLNLLKRGVDVNAKGGHFGTAVQAAAAQGHENIVRILIHAGADLRSQGGRPVNWGSRATRSMWNRSSNTEASQRYEEYSKKFEQVDQSESRRSQSGQYGTALQAAAAAGNVKIVAMLVQKGADINDIDILGQTPLHRATYYGHKAVVNFLSNKGAIVDFMDIQGRSPVLLAAMMGHTAIFRHLLDSTAKLKTMSMVTRVKLLHWGFNRGYIDIIEPVLAEDIDLNQPNYDGQTALFIAADRGHSSLVRFLVDRKADVQQCNSDNVTALHVAANAGHDDVIHQLLASGINTSAVDNEGSSALHCAASNGRSSVIYSLLEANIPRDLQDKLGKTALHLAAEFNHDDVVRVLLEFGANELAVDNEGSSALHCAASNGFIHVVSLLVGNSMLLNLQDKSGKTALHLAAEFNHDDVVRVLLRFGANELAVDNEGSSALHCAASNGFIHVVSLLVGNSMLLNLQDKLGRTPLYRAVESGDSSVICSLLDSGADINCKSNDRLTPLQISPSGEIWALLLDRGAMKPELGEVWEWSENEGWHRVIIVRSMRSDHRDLFGKSSSDSDETESIPKEGHGSAATMDSEVLSDLKEIGRQSYSDADEAERIPRRGRCGQPSDRKSTEENDDDSIPDSMKRTLDKGDGIIADNGKSAGGRRGRPSDEKKWKELDDGGQIMKWSSNDLVKMLMGIHVVMITIVLVMLIMLMIMMIMICVMLSVAVLGLMKMAKS